MPLTLDPGTVLALIAAAVVVFAARVVLLLASCSLAEAGEVRLGKALVLALVALVLCAQVSWGYGFLKERLPSSETAMIGPVHAVMALLTALAAWVLPAILYKFSLPTPWKKSVLVAGLEVLLGSLLAALVAGAVLVILAGVQVARRPGQTETAPPTAATTRLT